MAVLTISLGTWKIIEITNKTSEAVQHFDKRLQQQIIVYI